MKIEAASRLQAATDTKGAKAYLKEVFSNYDLGFKQVKSYDDEALQVIFKGPLGKVEVLIWASRNRNKVDVRIGDSTGICPRESDYYDFIPEAELAKNTKVDFKSVNRNLAKAAVGARQYSEDIEKVKTWVENFTKALTQISSEMD